MERAIRKSVNCVASDIDNHQNRKHIDVNKIHTINLLEMDYESEKILKLIFPSGVPEHLRESPELLPHIIKLGTLKVDQVRKEETHLVEENRAIVEQTQDLAITNYKAFIQTSECSRKIVHEFHGIEGQLDGLIDKLPTLTQKCENFINTSSEINSSRRLNSLTLRRNAQLLEILELPQLMDTCIHQGKYEEALELAAHVQRMGVKHSGIPVINNIVSAIEGSWHTMLTQLLAQLRTDLSLAKCLQVVGYLRRMQAFLMPELKLKFLQARDSWFCSILDGIPSEDPQMHLMKTIELSRVNLFNIITQYRATFADDDTTLETNDGNDCGNIFHSWINEKVNTFLMTLEVDLERGITSFDSVLGQCMYFGLSFSRIGADFRGLLVPIFMRFILKNISTGIVKVTEQFGIDMENYTFINKLSLSTFGINSRTDVNNLSPPEVLLNFHPLASYCNGILTVLNEFQHCAPIALVGDVTKLLEKSLVQVAGNIVKFYRQEQQALGAKERDNFVKFCCAFAYELVPYIQRCIQDIFPTNLLTTYLGINAVALQREGLTQLKKKHILEPLVHLLPDKVDAIIKEMADVKVSSKSVESDRNTQPLIDASTMVVDAIKSDE